ncbi:hypothetical protein KL919_002415 [Ogataea angusta]|nr:hypothetical protein KL943_003107 [Ogataea angusta]KAG7859710.1 hypothetical protein KL919_002415 [Ogataea angusta]
MDLYSVLDPNQQLTTTKSLKLVELNPEVLQAIENKSELRLKSATNKDYPVLVTASKTFKIRQKNHSNCVLLLSEHNGAASSYARFSNELVLAPIEPTINLHGISVLTDLSGLTSKNPVSLESIFENSPMSKEEFARLCPELNLVELEGNAYVLHEELVRDCLSSILRAIIEELVESGDEMNIMTRLQSLDKQWVIDVVDKRQEESYPSEIIQTVLAKYTREADEKLAFLNEKVVRLYGVLLLKNSTQNMKEEDFALNLKLTMPFNYHPNIKLEYLGGNFITENGFIRYFAESDLSENPVERISELFKLKKEWKLEEIEPFVVRINTKKIKTDKFLIKYAKVRRVGKQTVVCAKT